MLTSKKKTILLLVFATIFLLSITVTSATQPQDDLSDDTLVTTQENTYTANSIVNDTYKTKTTKKENSISVQNYEELYNQVTNTENSDEDLSITLDGDDEYTITNPIVYGTQNQAHTLTINGNGRIINGQNTYNFMTINNNYTLNIANITIQNLISDDNGPAFNVLGNLTANNITIENTYAKEHGGAISVNGSGVLNLQNSRINNSTSYMGGAIFTNSTELASISNNNITNTRVLLAGANHGGTIAIWNSASTNISNNTVINTTAPTNAGFAVIMNTNAIAYITNNTIINTSTSNGHAGFILNKGKAIIENNTIINSESTKNSGLITNNGELVFKYNNVTNVTSKQYGGLFIHDSDNSSTISYNNFTNISGATRGGAITVLNGSGLVFEHNNITNISNNEHGGFIALQDGSEALIKSNNIHQTSTPSKYGGFAILFSNSNITIADNNISNTYAYNGGFIYSQTDTTTTIENNTIENISSAHHGGFIYSAGNISFKNNTARNISTATGYNGAFLINTGYALIENNTLENMVSRVGTIAMLQGNSTTDIINNTIINATVNNNQYYLFHDRAPVNIINNTFINCTDYNRDMILNNSLTITSIYGNTYLSNYLKTFTNDEIIVMSIIIGENNITDTKTTNMTINPLYNDTVRDGKLIIVVNGEDVEVGTVENGVATISLSQSLVDSPGVYNLLYLSEDRSYQNNSLGELELINTYESNMELLSDVEYFTCTLRPAEFTIRLTDYAGNPLEDELVCLYEDGVLIDQQWTLFGWEPDEEVDDYNGMATFTYIPQTVGLKNITIEYVGTSYDYKSNITLLITVEQVQSTLDIIPVATTTQLSNTIYFTLTLKTILDAPIVERNVTITVANQTTIEQTDENGQIEYAVTTTKAGIYNLIAQFNDESFYPVTSSSTITVTDTPTIVSQPINKKINEEATISASIIDSNNDPVTEGTVTFKYANDTAIDVITLDNSSTATTTIVFNQTYNDIIKIEYTDSQVYDAISTTIDANIEKISTRIENDEIISISTGDKLVITGKLLDEYDNPLANAPITVIIELPDENITETPTTNDEGEFTTTEHDLADLTEAKAYINYEGNQTHTASHGLYPDSSSIKIYVRDANINLTLLNINNVDYTYSTLIRGTLMIDDQVAPSQTPIQLIIANETVNTSVVSNGMFAYSYTANVPGNITAYALYNNTPSNTQTFTVNPLKTVITAQIPEEVYVNQTIQITGTLKENTNNNPRLIANETIIIKVGQQELEPLTTNTMGEFTTTYKLTESGMTTITITYNQTDKYKYAQYTKDVYVTRTKTNLSLTTTQMQTLTPTTITGILRLTNQTPIADATITVQVNNQTDTTQTNMMGEYSYTFTPSTGGLNNITVSYAGTDTLEPATNTTIVDVSKRDTSFALVTDGLSVQVNDTINIQVGLIDQTEQSYINQPVKIIIENDTIDYNITTYIASFTYNNNPTMGTYNITYIYEGNDVYNPANRTTSYTVLGKGVYLLEESFTPNYMGLTQIPIVIIDAETDDIVDLEISFYYNNELVATAFSENGVVVFNITLNKSEDYDVPMKVEFEGNDVYNPASNDNIYAYYRMYDTIVSRIEVTDCITGDSIEINATLKTVDDDAPKVVNQRVSFIINGQQYYAYTNEYEVATIVYNSTSHGGVNVTVSLDYEEEGLFADSPERNTSFNVEKAHTILTITPADAEVGYDEIIDFTIKLTNANNRELSSKGVTIQVNNESHEYATDNHGEISISIHALTPGLNNITASFVQTEDFYATSSQTSFRVTKSSTNMILDDIEGYVGIELPITVELKDEYQNNIDEGYVTFLDSYNRVMGVVDVVDGQATLNMTFDKELNTTITAIYNSSYQYESAKKTVQLTITRKQAVVSMEPLALTFNSTVNLTATVTEEDQIPITGGKVIFKVNGKVLRDTSGKILYATVTDGVASVLDYSLTESWKNGTIKAIYYGSTVYSTGNTAETTLTVLPEVVDDEKIVLENYTATYGQTITIKARLENVEDLSSGKVLFKVNGKTVKDSVTNKLYVNLENGEATVSYYVPKTFKEGDYIIKAVYTNNNLKLETESVLTVTG